MTESMLDHKWDAAFEELLGSSADRLYAEDLACAPEVPADFLALGNDLFAPPAAPAVPVVPPVPAAPAAPVPAPAAPALSKFISGAVLVLLSAAVLTAGAWFVPPIHNAVWPDSSGLSASARASRAAKDYVIPAPWEGGVLMQEASGEHMALRWFQKGQRQVIVEITGSLPQGADLSGRSEAVSIDGIPGTWYPDAQALLLEDGNNYIYIGYWNGEKQEILDYAAAFAAANP